MPVFEVVDGELQPFRRRQAGNGLYERDVEELLWGDLESFLGESLFPVARQPQIEGGGRPDMVALDRLGNVHVIEVKRDIDRGQIAQCLEYAGWARTTSLDELAGLYHRGEEAFFADWSAFTESDTPTVLSRTPQLVLVARDLHGRTESAMDFLIENGLPVRMVRVSMYDDPSGRMLVDVEGDHEPEAIPKVASPTARREYKVEGRRVQIADLLEAGLLVADEELVWRRPQLGEEHVATVMANGSLRLADGQVCGSPSRAAIQLGDGPSYDGWTAWRRRRDDILINELRRGYIDQATAET